MLFNLTFVYQSTINGKQTKNTN